MQKLQSLGVVENKFHERRFPRRRFAPDPEQTGAISKPGAEFTQFENPCKRLLEGVINSIMSKIELWCVELSVEVYEAS